MTFDILTAGSGDVWVSDNLGVGAFDWELLGILTANSPRGIANRWAYRLTVNSGALLSADFDGNGVVDHHDFEIWNVGYGLFGNATRADGDADLDRDVDGVDFLVWQSTYDVGPAAASLPEPNAMILWLSLLLVSYARRR